MNLTSTDKAALDAALTEARQASRVGNYPVGAAIMLGDQLISGQNAGETTGNYSNHAESALITAHGAELLQAARAGQSITLYSTLEPCLMCLGTATMNKINRIIYIATDPHAGACGVDRASLGKRYQLIWPEIIHAQGYNQEAQKLLISFVQDQIDRGIRPEANQPILAALKQST